MLARARAKGVFQDLHVADLSRPLDHFSNDHFDGVILVGVFSYGQSPAHAREELVRITKPGGFLAFTMRTDFYDSNAMGVRSQIGQLQDAGAWRLVDLSDPEQYLPKKDPSVLFRVWCFEVLEGKHRKPSESFVAAAKAALLDPDPVKRLDHAHIWDPMASRLYEDYIRTDAYYLTECELEILGVHAEQIVAESPTLVELGCGSARKVRVLLDTALKMGESEIAYLPIDVSEGALAATCEELRESYGERVRLEPIQGRFRDVLAEIPAERGKNILFFGSSIGNLETPAATVDFLRELRELMAADDQLVIGFDLQKDAETLLRAYNAGPSNLAFFLHMVRRMNHELGANFDLGAFRLGSTCEVEPPWRNLETCRVCLRVVSEKPQNVHVPALGFDLHLAAGDAIQVGVSRKFRTDDIRALASLAGLRQLELPRFRGQICSCGA
ncbi:MAG: L-histidine N(alpha)-methyltransferase [Holophagales bacterium]|nr:L-histidine N(alpha)-methyltransferase [Holophagales bacterium]